mmetsp:Transcript_27594/g.55233  ORF Transcript_27594/g.55233 Transcript_27594/m.55233 type:complete len:190 (+) Transcript_27594:77-646(+)
MMQRETAANIKIPCGNMLFECHPEYTVSEIVQFFFSNSIVLDRCNRAGIKKAIYIPEIPENKNDSDKSFTHIDPIIGGIDATSLQNIIAIFVARSPRLFLLNFISLLPQQGLSGIINFRIRSTAPTLDANKLLPSVLAMSGKTDIVSSAGKNNMILDEILHKINRIGDDVSSFNPYLKLAKFKLILCFV